MTRQNLKKIILRAYDMIFEKIIDERCDYEEINGEIIIKENRLMIANIHEVYHIFKKDLTEEIDKRKINSNHEAFKFISEINEKLRAIL